MPTVRRTLLVALLLSGGAALTGCSGGPSASTPPSTDAASPSATPATATPIAEPTPGPPAVACDDVLTDEAIAQLQADGLELVDVGQSTFYPIADDLMAAGGLACKWGRPSSDANFTVVQLTGIDVATSEWPAALAAEGYVLTDDPVPGTHSGPEDPGTGVPSVVVVTDDSLTFVSTPMQASDLAVVN
ncbi:hypothetical protein ATC03_18950 [Agromyces aureus]|uniref:PASTA domain-containing protein n=2 Tax=Agromyces aureus TaxID=453304 RepID=A0A191WJM7_9MICO|nr:hypothetical protein ATC03_18950 [Agromyces aureus]